MISASGTGCCARRSFSALSSARAAASPFIFQLPATSGLCPATSPLHRASVECAFRPFAKILAKYPALPGLRLLPMMPPPRSARPASDAGAALANSEWKVLRRGTRHFAQRGRRRHRRHFCPPADRQLHHLVSRRVVPRLWRQRRHHGRRHQDRPAGIYPRPTRRAPGDEQRKPDEASASKRRVRSVSTAGCSSGWSEARPIDQHARALHLGISDAALLQEIMQDPNFKDVSGNFSPAAFQQALHSIGMTEQGYLVSSRERNLRRQILSTIGKVANSPVAAGRRAQQLQWRDAHVALRAGPAERGRDHSRSERGRPQALLRESPEQVHAAGISARSASWPSRPRPSRTRSRSPRTISGPPTKPTRISSASLSAGTSSKSPSPISPRPRRPMTRFSPAPISSRSPRIRA